MPLLMVIAAGGGGDAKKADEYAGWCFRVYIHAHLLRRESSNHG